MKLLTTILCVVLLLCSDSLARGGHHSSHRSTGYHATHVAHHRDSAYRTERNVSTSEKKELFKRSGIPWSQRHNYVVDHIVALENGGTNDISNLHIQTKKAEMPGRVSSSHGRRKGWWPKAREKRRAL